MKLFIIWSGDLSHRIALHLRTWLPAVISSVEAWVSSEDIPKGNRWGAELASQLDSTDAGIVCVTPGNLNEPWLNFEAGALSKSVQKGRVHPFLLGVDAGQLTGPLSEFQATRFDKDDVLKLVKAINAEEGKSGLPAEKLQRAFEVCWPDLERRLAPLLAEASAPHDAQKVDSDGSPAPTDEALTNEELSLLRAIANAGQGLHAQEAASILGVHPERARYLLEQLEERELLAPSHNYVTGTIWYLSREGRAALVRLGIL